VRTKANFDKQRAWEGFDSETPRKAIEEPGLGVGSGRIGMKTGKATGEAAAKAGRIVELEICDDAPGELIAAQDAGESFKRDGSREDGG